jgi:hypothetical protein
MVRLAVGKDRRRREVSITRAGRAMIAEARKYWRRLQRAFEDKLGADTSATLRVVLGRASPPRNFRSPEPRGGFVKAELVPRLGACEISPRAATGSTA